jgi:protein-disulfide isomerase
VSLTSVTRQGLIRTGTFVAVGAFVAGRGFADAPVDVTAPQADDRTLGNPKARVTVIEYASVGCPHCAKWATDVFPAFRAKFIATGRVRFVLREVITGQATLATAGFMLARCAPPERYFDVVDGVFARQAAIFEGKISAGDALTELAKSIGMDDDAFHACLTSQANLDEVNARSDRHFSQDGVSSTPTFYVGERRLDGELSLAQLATAIAAAGSRRRRH